MLQGMQVEMCLLGENDLKAFAADAVDTPTREAIEAYATWRFKTSSPRGFNSAFRQRNDRIRC
jgi:hypothetical protein